jgi:hypothetical protein
MPKEKIWTEDSEKERTVVLKNLSLDHQKKIKVTLHQAKHSIQHQIDNEDN